MASELEQRMRDEEWKRKSSTTGSAEPKPVRNILRHREGVRIETDEYDDALPTPPAPQTTGDPAFRERVVSDLIKNRVIAPQTETVTLKRSILEHAALLYSDLAEREGSQADRDAAAELLRSAETQR